MYKYLLIRGAIVLVAITVLSGILLAIFGYLYRATENKNFADLRKKAELDCAAMPYHCAIKEDTTEKIKALSSEGANINSLDRFGNTPLLYALSWNTSLVESLLESGADPNIPNEQGLTPLQQSLHLEKYTLAKKLVTHGADPDAKAEGDQKKYLTLLTYFITNKNQVAATFLVEHGADLTLRDGYGYTACERTVMYKSSSLFPFCNKQ